MEKKKIANLRVKKVEEPCRHPAIFKSMCVSCGLTIRPSSPSNSSESNGSSFSSASACSSRQAANSSSLLFAGGNRLLLSKDEALRVQRSKSLGLQSSHKLALVLDLDHTLVHATGAWSGYAAALGPLLGDGSNDIRKIFIEEGPGMPPKCYLVKLRPHLESFLKEAHAICQMTIYTAGTRLYAEAVAKLIDPLGLYFAQRIVSRTDIPNDKSEGLDKSLQRIFLEDASMVVVMDDREDVWKGEQAAQLLLVRPFHYFTGCEEVNNAAGSAAVSSGPLIKLSGDRPGALIDPSEMRPPSTLTGAPFVPQNDYDDQLPRCISIIKSIHQKFFASNMSDSATISGGTGSASGDSLVTVGASVSTGRVTVANIINDMKQSILAGCTIAFSGVIPVRTPMEQHSAWLLAESMGARMTSEVTAGTTHLLTVSMPPAANGQGQPGMTSKAKECLGRGDVWVLHPDWLSYCRFSLAKAVESTFMLIAQTPGRPLPNPVLREHARLAPSSSGVSRNGSSSETRVRFREEIAEFDEERRDSKRKRYSPDEREEAEAEGEDIEGEDIERVEYEDLEATGNGYNNNDEDDEGGGASYDDAGSGSGQDDDDDDDSAGSSDDFESSLLLREG